MGLILTFIAYLLLFIFYIPSLLIGVVVSLFEHRGNRYFKDWAISLDQHGNVVCQYLFNLLLIKKGGYRFGNTDETVSSCLGKNYRKNTLTTMGSMITTLLNFLDKNHAINSIDETIN